MCGIVYAHDFAGNAVNNGILNQFDAQRGRGTQGFGLFDGRENHIVRSATEDKILKWLVKYESELILFHHRFPTSTDNTKNTAHPFSTKDYFGDNQYILVHNGHITNSYMLKADHEKLGISYSSIDKGKFNDSESLLWDMALYLEGKQDSPKAYGGMAFICIKLHKGKLDKMYFGRNYSPLNLLKVKEGICLSSEGPGVSITPNTLYTWNYTTKRLTNRTVVFAQYKPYEYEPRYEPRYVVPYKSNVERYMEEEYAEEQEINPIDDFNVFEVKHKMLRYLISANGKYQLAYDAMDLESVQLEGDPDPDNQREQQLLWASMDMMETESDWVNQDSICNLFLEASDAKEVQDGRKIRLPLQT